MQHTPPHDHDHRPAAFPRSWLMFAVVAAIAASLLGIARYSQVSADRLTRRYTIITYEAMAIRQQITEAHLWFEELLSGDEAEDVNRVWLLLDGSMLRAMELMEGRRGADGALEFRPLGDAGIRASLGRVVESLAQFRELAMIRWEERLNGPMGAGSPLDAEQDEAFELLMARTEAMQQKIISHTDRQRSAMRLSQNVMMAAILVLSVLLALVLHRFLSAQERDRRSLARSRRRLATILNTLGEAVLSLDAQGAVLLMNPAAEALTGLSADEARGRPLAEVVRLRRPDTDEPVDAASQTPGCAAAMADPRGMVLLARDGTRRRVSACLTPAETDQDAGPEQVPEAAAVLVLQDIAQRIRMEELLAQSDKMLSVGGLASGMAHEINNPLAGILQSAQNIERRVLEDTPANREAAQRAGCGLDAIRAYCEERKVGRMITGIRDLAQRAADIVAALLEFSHDGSGERSEHDLRALAAEALELAGRDQVHGARRAAQRWQFINEIGPEPLPVRCSAPEIRQALFNVLRNAAQAAARGGGGPVTVRTGRQGGSAFVEVVDQGPGMSEEVRRRATEPFFTTLPPDQGRGLGLAVAYFIVSRNHGGGLEIESSPGRGATVRILLPGA